MSAFIGQIIMFGGNFAPRNWALCHGQLLPINQNQALFSILGTTYGGDGRTTFGLPDFRGRAAIGQGQGPGLSNYNLGAKGGTETNTLNSAQLPSHNHTIQIPVSDEDPTADEPSGKYLANGSFYNGTPANGQQYGSGLATGNTGSNQSVNNLQPFQVVNYIICLFGVFPSRN